MNFVVKDIKRLEKYYDSIFRKMERLGNKKDILSNKQYIKLNELLEKVDILEPFFQVKQRRIT